MRRRRKTLQPGDARGRRITQPFSLPLSSLLDKAISRYEAARDAGRYRLAQKHWKIKAALERLIFGDSSDGK